MSDFDISHVEFRAAGICFNLVLCLHLEFLDQEMYRLVNLYTNDSDLLFYNLHIDKSSRKLIREIRSTFLLGSK